MQRKTQPLLILLFLCISSFLPLLTQPTPIHSQTNDVICDNLDSCFSDNPAGARDRWGFIPADGFGSFGAYNGQAYWTFGESTPIASGRWTPNLPRDGFYAIDIWYPSFDGIVPRTNSAHYRLRSIDGDRSVVWNQATNAGRWNEIATEVRCNAGTDCFVELSDKVNETADTRRVYFDAVRFRYVRPLVEPTPPSTIRGRITDETGISVEAVTIQATTGDRVTTDNTGSYTLTDLAAGTYTLTPSKAGCVFTPATLSVTVPPDATGQDFTATCTTPTSRITGQVIDDSGNPLAGVAISTDTGSTTTTDNNGDYTLTDLTAGTYTLNASRTGCTFTPATVSVNVPPDATGQDFTATCTAFDRPTLSLDLATNAIEPDENFEFRVVTTGIPNAIGIEFALAYDSNAVACEIGFPGNDQSFPFFTLERSVCDAAPGRYEWVSTISQGGIVAGELARIRFRSLATETSSTIGIVPGSVRAVDENGNLVPVDVGTDEITIAISAAAIEGVISCQAGSPTTPRQTRIFGSSFNGNGTSLFTLSQSGVPYALPASTSGNPWSVIAACDCHLNARVIDVLSPSTGNNATLPAGDLVGAQSDRDDGEINVRDAIAMAIRLGGPAGDLACADLNQDGTVNVSDMAILRGNFGLREFVPFDGAPPTIASAAPADAATVNCRVEPMRETNHATMIIEVDGVTDLYGYSFNLTTSPTLVQPTPDGWDISNSLLRPDTDTPSLLEVQNDVAGNSLDVAVVRQNPAQAVSGSGELARIELHPGTTTGTHTFSFDDIILADQDADFIPHQVGDMSQCQFVSNGIDDRNMHDVFLPLVIR